MKLIRLFHQGTTIGQMKLYWKTSTLSNNFISDTKMDLN